ncbi:MAG: hypothetical protein NT031_17615 [Planctomycetota bacterium]|nr:hypothetical protein [Planctomycetota bacterium]
MKNTILVISFLALAAASGCGSEFIGQRQPLGLTAYDTAFTQAKAVLEARRFSIVEANPASGTIIARSDVQDTHTRLVSTTPTRSTATLRIQRTGGNQVVAYASVIVEEKANVPMGMMPNQGSYSGAPNETPLETGAALSHSNNDEWRRAGADRDMERRLLAGLSAACRAR